MRKTIKGDVYKGKISLSIFDYYSKYSQTSYTDIG